MNHYERLGVPSGATAAEIRAAYRRAARDAHPDRHGDASASQMASVNEAWRVLGDPGRRDRYDRELAAADTSTRGVTPPDRGAAPTGVRPNGVGERPPLPPTGDLSRFPWRFFAIVFVVAVVVVFVGNTITEAPPPAPVDNLLQPGECVRLSDLPGELVPAPCDGGHEAVVMAVVGADVACPPGSEPFRDPQGRGNACIVRTVAPD